MIEAFARTHDTPTVHARIEKMIHDIETMIRIFFEHSLLVEDLQWMVSSEDLSLRIVDPLSLVYLRPADGTHGPDVQGPFTKKHFGRKHHDFWEQQAVLIRLSDRLGQVIGHEPRPRRDQQISPFQKKRKGQKTSGVTVKKSRRG